MSAPTPYDRQNSFALLSAENPGEPPSGSLLDTEFNAIVVSMAETQSSLALIQDADGLLARQSVGTAQFDSSVTVGIAPPRAWATATTYTANVSTVFQAGKFYRATVTHASGVSFDVTKWEQIADFTLANTLSDGSVTTAKLADANVTAVKLAPLAVTSSKIAAAAVGTTQMADAAVTPAKMSSAAAFAAALIPAGVMLPFAASLLPTGWLWCDGTIVSAAGYPALNTALNGAYNTGAEGAGNFRLPDMRGRVPVGQDNLGFGGAAGRITAGESGIAGFAIGAAGGSQSEVLTAAQLPPTGYSFDGTPVAPATVNLNQTVGNQAFVGVAGTTNSNTANTGNTTPTVTVPGFTPAGAVTVPGGGNSHSKVQPSLVCTYIIKAH